DFIFITGALHLNIRSQSIEDVHILLRNIDMAEKIVPHKVVVTLRVFWLQAYIFIHVKGDHMFERNFTEFVKGDQFAVDSQG
ncbi:MAG TPA: hypothetical protein PK162_09560, partial [Synergistales bacterium]|nr:hypothetical protein [Synergistales bacterium]